MEKVKLLNFKINKKDDSNLIAIENNKDIPFKIKRVFYIYGVKEDAIRGQHANKKSKMVLIALNGSCMVKTITKEKEQIFKLDSKDIGLFTDKMVWKEIFNFSSDCVLFILTDSFFDPDEYISNLEEFLKY